MLINQEGKLLYTAPDAPRFLVEQVEASGQTLLEPQQPIASGSSISSSLPTASGSAAAATADALDYSDLLAQSLQTQRGCSLFFSSPLFFDKTD